MLIVSKPEKKIAAGGILNELVLLGSKIKSIRDIKSASTSDEGSLLSI